MVAERDGAPRVATIRIDDEDRPPLVFGGAVEIDAERVVERRPPVGAPAADPFHQARELPLLVARHPHLGVEVDERDVPRVAERVEEADGSGARQLDVLAHAAAGVEQQADVQLRGRGGFGAPREVRDRLALAVLENLQVVGGQVGDEVPAAVGDGDTDVHQLDAGAERRLLSSRADTRQQHQQRPDPSRAGHAAHPTGKPSSG
jgi:hypothetical protein